MGSSAAQQTAHISIQPKECEFTMLTKRAVETEKGEKNQTNTAFMHDFEQWAFRVRTHVSERKNAKTKRIHFQSIKFTFILGYTSA